jgi:hypothetical protein
LKKTGSFPSADRIARKLGDLNGVKHENVGTLIVARGGTGANVREAGVWAEETLLSTVQSALAGNAEAEKAVKIVKQARRLGEKH